ncbi:DUF547 domain-containing protein [Deltaproteobacteria bacterium IMCC39524]|nr:DUF547 domain-containing protein [Deltaproteobacteria bacterium IMCC39524]
MTLFRKQLLGGILLLAAVLLLLVPVPGQAEPFDHEHAAWSLLVKNNVHWNLNRTASQVNYDGFQETHDFLKRYLFNISAVTRAEFDTFSREQQLAFLINAYNAFTVELILTEYPELTSIKELGSLFSSPWKRKFFHLLGESQNLDGIEHDLIRGSGRYDEPLIHFAVNCASIGCPALLDEAFVAEKLDQQLLESTGRFLNDRNRNRFDAKTGTLEISSIFDWYAEDFSKGWRGYDSLHDFFRTHGDWITDDAESAEKLREVALRIEFLDYDWSLNTLR